MQPEQADNRNASSHDSHGLERAEQGRSRWAPRPEQIKILESIFDSGMVNPPREETVRIRKLLEPYGAVAEANVFYWFQNRRSRSRRRQRLLQAAQMLSRKQPAVVPRMGATQLRPSSFPAVLLSPPSSSPCVPATNSSSYGTIGDHGSCSLLPVSHQMAVLNSHEMAMPGMGATQLGPSSSSIVLSSPSSSHCVPAVSSFYGANGRDHGCRSLFPASHQMDVSGVEKMGVLMDSPSSSHGVPAVSGFYGANGGDHGCCSLFPASHQMDVPSVQKMAVVMDSPSSARCVPAASRSYGAIGGDHGNCSLLPAPHHMALSSIEQVGVVMESPSSSHCVPAASKSYGAIVGDHGNRSRLPASRQMALSSIEQIGLVMDSPSSSMSWPLSEVSNLNSQLGSVIVFINGVATEVPNGPLDVRTMFGPDVVLFHSSVTPVAVDELGVTVQSLLMRENYFLVSMLT